MGKSWSTIQSREGSDPMQILLGGHNLCSESLRLLSVGERTTLSGMCLHVAHTTMIKKSMQAAVEIGVPIWEPVVLYNALRCW